MQKASSMTFLSTGSYIDTFVIDEEVIVQAGYTKYFSDKMKIFDLISQEDFVLYMNRADLIITHGGVGSIITALKMNKKIIAVPRLAKYGEHINDHQLQIVKCFEKKNSYTII